MLPRDKRARHKINRTQRWCNRCSSSSAPKNAAKVAHQIWLNETGGIRDVITAWNASEDFASLGIGHFIWFPEGLDSRFDESFPEMLQYLRSRGAKPPAWLAVDPVPAAPWATKAEFDAAFKSSRMKALRRFLLDTMDLQAEFLVLRLQQALPKLLANADDPAHIERQFARVVAASPDLYPLIDYVNFKGEGTKASEVFRNPKTGVRQGWGPAAGSGGHDGNVAQTGTGSARILRRGCRRAAPPHRQQPT